MLWRRDVRILESDQVARDANKVVPLPPSAFDVRVLRQHGSPMQLEDQNICIASPLLSPNNFNPPFSSPSAWQATPTIPTFVPIKLFPKACPSHMMGQTLGYKTSLHVHSILKSVKGQVFLVLLRYIN